MKSRLGITISPLFAGEFQSCIRKAISVYPNFAFSHGEAKRDRFLFKGLKGLQQWVHTAYDEEDDFLELGQPVTQGIGTTLKLATEKRDPFRKKDPATTTTACDSSCAEAMIPTAKDLLLNLDEVYHARPKLENHSNKNNNSMINVNIKRDSNFRASSSIVIEDVPSTVNLSQLIQAVSSFGKVTSVSMRNSSTGFDCCDVKFENEESGSKAVAAGRVKIQSFQLPIRPHFVPKSVIIRIENINKDTAYNAIHSTCKILGEFDGMARASEDAVDAFFSLKDSSEAQNILAELNKTIVNDCQWSAHILEKPSDPVTMSQNEVLDLGLQISSHLIELKRECNMRKVYAEDLECMHMAIMHLEETAQLR